MSIISPCQRSKPTIAMHSVFKSIESTMNRKQPTKRINEYTIYIMLEKQRNKKLKELYHGNSATPMKEDNESHDDMPLPKFPPRYQSLDLPAQWFVSEIEKQRRVLCVDDATKEQWKATDRTTRTFLEDMVNVLRDRQDSSTSSRRSTPPCLPSLSPVRAITPPSSPLTLREAPSYDSQETRTQAERPEVDMSDDEIISLWNCATPSAEGFDLDIVY